MGSLFMGDAAKKSERNARLSATTLNRQFEHKFCQAPH